MTKKKAFLSIIIAAHNSEDTLPETLQNLLNACIYDFTGIEIILINDSSNDSTAIIVRTFAASHPQVRHFNVNYQNIGQVRQFGIENSTGDYITMLDSDDLMKHGSLTKIIDFLKENRPDMLLTKLIEVREKSNINFKWNILQAKKISSDEAITLFLIHKDLQAHLIGQFIKRELYLDNVIPPMTCYEDFYVFPKILSRSQEIYFLRKGHYFYVKRSGSLSNTPNQQKITNLIICTQKMTNIFAPKYRPLILCHWLDIYLKHSIFLQNVNEMDIVRSHVRETWSAKFLSALNVRLSYKRKAISLFYKNIKKSL